jgi:hypothetical protein
MSAYVRAHSQSTRFASRAIILDRACCAFLFLCSALPVRIDISGSWILPLPCLLKMEPVALETDPLVVVRIVGEGLSLIGSPSTFQIAIPTRVFDVALDVRIF